MLWSTSQELADMNMGRMIDGLALFGVIRLCNDTAEAARVAAGMAELARAAPKGMQ